MADDQSYNTYAALRDDYPLKEDLDEGNLQDYEELYFDKDKVAEKVGVHRYSGPNIQAAIKAGWFITVPPLQDLGPLQKKILSDLVDGKYQEYTTYKTDPNGSGG